MLGAAEAVVVEMTPQTVRIDAAVTINDLNIDEINIVQKSHLLENFNQHAKEHNYKHRAWSAQRFGLQIKKLLPKLETSRSSGQPRVFKFPSLKECQISFTKKYGLQFENDLNIP